MKYISCINKYKICIEPGLQPDDSSPQYESVDLGLPSGTKWATMNVGATSETDYGNYYMYGMGDKTYDSTDTPYAGTENPLDLSKDTARQVMGGEWHMPTEAQIEELVANTTYQWVTDYNDSGVNGGLFTAQNGNSVFFPAGGHWYDNNQYVVDSHGYYWSSSPNNNNAYFFEIHDGANNIFNMQYKFGFSVRGVIG